MTAEIWFDFVCPWCYLGTRRWADATEGTVATRWRSFELGVDAPTTPGKPVTDLMRTDWGMTDAQADAAIARIHAAGTAAGLPLRTGEARPVNTRDAHRLVHLAAGHDAAPDVIEQVFAAYHVELRDIADHTVLSELATAAGLPEREVTALWQGTDHLDTVRSDEALGAEVGVRAVPSYRVDGRLVSGALSAEELRALVSPR